MTLIELIDKTEGLPPAPEVLPKLVKLMQDPDAGTDEIVSLIATDPAVVAGVLRLSNSGAYSPISPVTDLSDAVSMLGIKEVYRIVNILTSGDYLDGSLDSMDIAKGSLWEHSLAVALIMDIIAKGKCEMEGLPYTLGLLHDIGKLLLHLGCGDRYRDVFKAVETERQTINSAERLTLGFDHAEAGATMLEEWGFPKEVFIPVRYQYNPEAAPEFKELAGALQLANWGAAVIGCNDGRDAWAMQMDSSAFALGEGELERALIEARAALDIARNALFCERT